MALILSGYDLIVRISDLPGGLPSFGSSLPNVLFCSDRQIASASFMVETDCDEFAKRLQVPSTALARAYKHTLSVDVEWLECGRYAGVDAVWLRGVTPEPLVVPVAW